MAPEAIIGHPLIQYGREVCGDLAAGLRRGRVMSKESRRAAEAERDEAAETAAQAKDRLGDRESRRQLGGGS